MADTLVMYEKDGYDTDELISATNLLKDQIVYMWQCCFSEEYGPRCRQKMQHIDIAKAAGDLLEENREGSSTIRLFF